MPTLDATKGGANANSYATAVEADTWLDAMYGAEEWADIVDDDKARLLIMATRMIDNWTPKYSSADLTTPQALNFPLLVEDNGVVSTDDGFAKAKRACIAQAFYLFKNMDVIQGGQSMAIQGTKAETIGPTSKDITGLNPFRKYDPEVLHLLHPYLELDFVTGRGPTTRVYF